MNNETAMEMPRYRSHKEVWALKIKAVVDPTEPDNETDGSRILEFCDHRYAPMRVNHEYVRKHNPQEGGYYVVYPDGYKSWSPAEAFEGGYSLVSAGLGRTGETMHHSITYLEQSLQVLVNNEPISRAEGNIDQADLEKASAEEIRDAIDVLKNRYKEVLRLNY